MGGEGAIPPETGFFYPWVVDVLAPRFKALVIEPEHRFYGTSLPLNAYELSTLHLLTPQQALADTATLIRYVQAAYNCSLDRGPRYCPVITIGGSYPGWLSAMMRLRYPAVVDGAYAASAPTSIYAQQIDQYAYYRVVTQTAEKAAPGCAKAVRSHLDLIAAASTDMLVDRLGLCEPLPPYIIWGGDAMLSRELILIAAVSFAGLDMGYYPPLADARLTKACNIFLDDGGEPWRALKEFFTGHGGVRFRPGHGLVDEFVLQAGHSFAASSATCLNLTSMLPARGHGGDGTFSCGDWSGCGGGYNGLSWDYETCSYCVEPIGLSGVTDMFPPREWSMSWLKTHCASRFGIAPRPTALVEAWGFDETGLRAQGASNILFTNGLNDGWSVGDVARGKGDVDRSRDLLVINMPNGAHHSDLSHSPPGPQDTEDVVAAREMGSAILERWIKKAIVTCGTLGEEC
eukprot:CAMPEP_0174705638 /NCGR_PEP_ID=MMETSP1094-20130205/8792_1 /TAXON_ID=156173 /ORGANISM="Chrysochromulina brevifilum, Strain UTEX LB 985" /LENGTH=458 /DNA_ID=CAMNT_0015903833 /DNA_START=484 /DNA_END=1860 /DNA_ORIENTATION=+